MSGSAEIIDNTATSNAGGVGVQSAAAVTTVFDMRGGVISDNKSNAAAGVYIVIGIEFNMTVGEIVGNTSVASGGGVIVHLNSQFTMSGGEISGNKSGTNGGGLSVSSGSTFTVSGDAVISGTKAGGSGGGVDYGECRYIYRYARWYVSAESSRNKGGVCNGCRQGYGRHSKQRRRELQRHGKSLGRELHQRGGAQQMGDGRCGLRRAVPFR